MNPELRRNLWLELSPSRLALMAGVLGLILGIGWLATPDGDNRPLALAAAGETLFGLIVGLWGSFKAGRSVSDEIREKTWDFQRLSALSPSSMMLGKLFGATSYVWFGGAITLAAVGYGYAMTYGATEALAAVGKLALLGVIAHAVALATSLAVVRRGRGRERVDAFLYTIAGFATFQTLDAWSGRKSMILRGVQDALPDLDTPTASVQWLGLHLSSEGWAFLLLGALSLWAVGTCWRLMRVELQAPANPLWFPLFLFVPTVLAAGRMDALMPGLALAYAMVHGLVLVTLLLEPKDFVSWRSLVSEIGKTTRGVGRYWPAALTGLIVAFILACVVAVAALNTEHGGAKDGGPLVAFAAFAFLLRETAIFAFFHLGARQRRGDFAAIVTIALLCIAGPSILGVLHLETLSGAFFVKADGDAASHLLSIAAGLLQAAIFGVAAQGRWRVREKRLAVA